MLTSKISFFWLGKDKNGIEVWDAHSELGDGVLDWKYAIDIITTSSEFNVINEIIVNPKCTLKICFYFFNGLVEDNKGSLVSDLKEKKIDHFIEECLNLKGTEADDHCIRIYITPFSLENYWLGTIYNAIKPDKRLNYFDSSIWCRHISLENLEQDWRNVGEYILFNLENDVYKMVSSIEVEELFRRIVQNSKLRGPSDKSGHSKNIIPFVFHSEGKIIRDLENPENFAYLRKKQLKFRDDCDEKLIKIKILLVDDYAADKIPGTDKTKMELIASNLEYYLKKSSPSGKIEDQLPIKFVIDKATKSNYALYALGKKTYDLIFVDYLLGSPDASVKIPSDERTELNKSLGRELGTHFVEKLIRSKDVPNGLFGKHWIFPITTYNSAFFDHLNELGINAMGNNYFIERGADPVNTPALFFDKLIKLIEVLVCEGLPDADKMTDFFSEFMKEMSSDLSASKIENEARISLNRFIYEFGTFEMLGKDKENGSLLAASLLNIKTGPAELLFSRIRKFLFMMAYRNYNHLAELMNALYAVEDSISPIQDRKSQFSEFRKSIVKSLEF